MNELPQFSNGVDVGAKELIALKQGAQSLLAPRAHKVAKRAGHLSSKVKGKGMEFAEVRAYQPGDDVRSIDWRVTARTGSTHTKIFHEERERPVMLFVDLGHSSHFGSSYLLQSVQMCHLATTLGWQAIERGDRIGGVLCAESAHRELKPRSRKQGILQLIHQLESLHQLGKTNPVANRNYLEHGLARLSRMAMPGSLVYLISDGSNFSQACSPHIEKLVRHCQVQILTITDPLRLPSDLGAQFNSVPVFNGQQTALFSRAQFQEWQNKEGQKLKLLDRLAARFKLPHFTLSAAEPLTKQLGAIQ